jgi:signal transduction histidine kinase
LSLLATVLLLLCGYLFWRLRTTSRIIRQLIEADGKSDPVLLEEDSSLIRRFRLDQLVRVFNGLILEKAQMSGTGDARHEQIQTLLGNLREAVVVVDDQYLILSANRAFVELSAQQEDPRGSRLDILLGGPEFQEFLHALRGKEGPRHGAFEVEIGGRAYWLETSAALLANTLGADGSQILFVFQDITRQNKLEKMRTEFVANVSHELKTPVTIIKGFAQTLIEDDADLSSEERLRFLEKILNNSDRLHSLLQDLLLLSRLESTDMILQAESVPMGSFLAEIADNWRSTSGSGIELITDFAQGNDYVKADPLRLTQVVTNLLDNAVRHGDGLSRINIRTRLSGKAITTEVEDNGNGIPEKELPHIFERFYRVEKGRSREAGGTGLGLSIVKHIVGQHGGQIDAWSRRGEGTRIEFTLPTVDT